MGEPPADGLLAAELESRSRIPSQTSTYGDVYIEIRPLGESTLPVLPGAEYAEIRFAIDAPDDTQALERAHPALELVLDHLSFQMQLDLAAVQLEVLDVTPPVAIGDERDCRLYPFPQGYQQWKFARSTPLGVEAVALVPNLKPTYDALARATQQALDWYLKGLQAQADADRFIFFWIALEVLEQATDGDVADTYHAACGHEIPSCPTCGKSTQRRVPGQSLRAFLEATGVSTGDARRLWKMRMLVHGAKSFDPAELEDLGRLLQILRAAVVAILKEALGQAGDQPPIVGQSAPAIRALSLTGTRALDERDALPMPPIETR